MKKLFLILCFCIGLYGIETDFDSVVVGTSPFSMFEAIYRRGMGERVLVLEQTGECGGAWKSIPICGVPHVDLGCHEFGSNWLVCKFLEKYAGCRMVTPEPNLSPPQAGGGFYPSQGCYELARNLEYLMQTTGVVLMLNTKLESLFVDTNRSMVEVYCGSKKYTTKQVVLTHCSEIQFDNPQIQESPGSPQTYYHVGLLIADPTPPQFTYRNISGFGASRATNYTPYSAELKGTGKQLITIQVHSEQAMKNAEQFFNELKKQKLIDPTAQLLKTENYIYKQGRFNPGLLQKLGPDAQDLFEILNTGHITNLSNYIKRWKSGMKPWGEPPEGSPEETAFPNSIISLQDLDERHQREILAAFSGLSDRDID